LLRRKYKLFILFNIAEKIRIMEYFIAYDNIPSLINNDGIKFIRKFLKFLQKNKSIKFFTKKINIKSHFSEEEYTYLSFSFEKYQKGYTYILDCHDDGITLASIFHFKGGKYKGKKYLPILIYYNIILYLLNLGCKNLELIDMEDGSHENVIINDIKDIEIFFDNQGNQLIYTDIKKFKKSYKSGKDLIQYLEVPYQEAKKIKNFPKEWII